jgi:hypothetical protein
MFEHVQPLKLLGKVPKLRIFGACLDVKCKRYDLKDISVQQSVVLLQIVKQSLLIAYEMIAFKMVMQSVLSPVLPDSAEDAAFPKLQLIAIFGYLLTCLIDTNIGLQTVEDLSIRSREYLVLVSWKGRSKEDVVL